MILGEVECEFNMTDQPIQGGSKKKRLLVLLMMLLDDEEHEHVNRILDMRVGIKKRRKGGY